MKRPASRRKQQGSDRMLVACGVLLAGAAIAFPLHVIAYPELYGPPTIRFSGNWARLVDGAAMDKALADAESGNTKALRPELDRITTGTVAPGRPVSVQREAQPNAVWRGYRLVALLDGRAVIEGSDGPTLIEVGVVVPGLGRVIAIERTLRGGRILLEGGEISASR